MHKLTYTLTLLIVTLLVSTVMSMVNVQRLGGISSQDATVSKEFQVSELFGVWRNAVVTEDLSFWCYSTDTSERGNPQIWFSPKTTFRPGNFWIIAEILDPDSFVECSYEIDASHYSLTYNNGCLNGIQWDHPPEDSWVSITSVPSIHLDFQYDSIAFNPLRYTYTWRVTVPEEKTIRLHIGTDYISGGMYTPIVRVGSQGHGTVFSDWKDYFWEPGGSSIGVWITTDTFSIRDPLPVNQNKLTFCGYWYRGPNGTRLGGDYWLPNTNGYDIIGLAFHASDPNNNILNQFVYEVIAMSTWQGECMNYPLIALAEGNGKDDADFDFQVLNEDGHYDVRVHNTDVLMDGMGAGWGRDFENQAGTVSVRGYQIRTTTAAKDDTLWLKAKDFGAHCVVVPHCPSPDMLRLRGDTNWVYPNHPVLRSISVPRDDDGYQVDDVNYGDNMADAWEENVLGVGEYNPAIISFLPFENSDSISADPDTDPAGLGIDGDRLANWEEYRGFILTGGLDSLEYVAPKHYRTSPFNKSVLTDWRLGSLPHLVEEQIPGRIVALPADLEIEYVRSFQTSVDTLFNPLHIEPVARLNANQKGASFPYYHVRLFTDTPAFREQRTVVWTSAKPLDYELYLDVDACGIFWHTSPYLSKRAGIPETTNRCSVLIDKVNALKQKLLYYRNNPDLFPRDRDRMIRCIIGHEFGHSIGMTDQYFWADFHLMSGVYWYRDTQRLIFEWPYDTTYSDSSKSEITVALKSDTVFYARIDTSQPPTYTPVYLPSSFMENQYESAYYAQMRVKNAISATSSVIFPAEPGGGYPGHTANVQGLSDTIKIVVELANYTGSPISLSGISAQNWFAPVLYDVNANVYTAPPLAEGSQVNYMFKRWEGVMGNPLTPPTELDLYENTPVLVYYLWNPPRKGPLRVVMNKTSNAPSNLYSLYGFGNVFYSITTSGAVIEDTINAYLACADRAWRGGDYSVGIYWANQILNLNPQSLVGYRLLNRIYEEMGDSLNQLATYDSLFAIMDRNGDPLVPPQAEWNRVWQLWYKDLSDAIKWKYWYFIRGLPRPFAM